MRAQNCAKRFVKQVGARVVGFRGTTLIHIHASHERGFRMFWQLVHQMDRQVVFGLHVKHVDGLGLAHKYALVAYLTTHLGIEWSGVEHHFVAFSFLLLNLSIFQYITAVFCVVVTHELAFSIFQHYPVAGLNLCGIAGAGFLLLHLHVETSLVNCHAIFAAYQLGQVKRETIGVEQREGFLTGNFCLA